MLVVGGFAFRLVQGPINLDFAKDYVQEALNEQSDQVRVDMNTLKLEWSAYKNAVLLTLGDVQLFQKIGDTEQEALEIDKAMLGLSAPYLLVGKIKPSTVVIEGPVLKFTLKDGEYDFFWADDGSQKTQSDDAVESMSSRDVRYKVAGILSDVASPVSGAFAQFSEMSEVALRRAVLKQVVVEEVPENSSYTNLALNEAIDVLIDDIVWDVVAVEQNYIALFDLALRRSDAGLNGELDVQLPSDAGQSAGLKAELAYRKEQKDLTFDGKFTDINPSRYSFLFPQETLLTQQDFILDGSLQMAFDAKMRLHNAALSLSMPEGVINIPEEYAEPLVVKDVSVQASMDRLEKKIALDQFKATVEGIPVEAKAIGVREPGHGHFPLSLNVAKVQFEDIAKLLPKSAEGTSAHEWLTKRLLKGHAHDVSVTTELDIHKDKESGEISYEVADPKASFNFEGLTVQYSDTLMPVTDAIGKGVYENDSIKITGEKGDIGPVKGTNIKVDLTDLSVAGGGLAKISLKGNGPLKTILDYISDDPIALDKNETGIDPDSVKGNVTFDLDLQFPTLKDLPKEEVTVIVDGTITDALLPKIVQGLDLTGGPYKLKFEKGKIDLSGKGQLSGRAIDVVYQQYLDPTGQPFSMRVNAKVLADEGLRQAFEIGLEEYISGNVPIDVVYTEKVGGDASVQVKGTMAPATVTIEPFKYEKKQGIDGTFSLTAFLSNDTLAEIDHLNLSTSGLSFKKGRILFRKDNQGGVEIARGSIDLATIGRTHANVGFEVTPNDVLKVIAKGAVIDIAPFINKDKKEEKKWDNPSQKDGQAMVLSLKADKAFTTDKEFLRAAQFYIETDKDSDMTRLEVDAKVGKSGNFYVRFKPEGGTGKRTFRMESTDAGATLQAFDLYKDVVGGSILVYGRPQQGDKYGDLFGTARLQNFTVKNAPALARILGSMSEEGMQNALKTKGVSFSKLESKFEWRFRSDGNLLVLKEGRTSGSSLGLTFEGVVDIAKASMDLSGTVIPLSGLNKAIGDIPLIGDILTGGSAGGLFAATYTVSGAAGDPKVVVNPLSVLTPGFLRKILFEGGFEESLPENKAPSSVNE